MGFKPAAWYVERVAPGKKDDGAKLALSFKKEEAEEWVDEKHVLRMLYEKVPNKKRSASKKTLKKSF